MPPATQTRVDNASRFYPDAVVEIVDKGVDATDNINKVVRIIAGSEAYRRYNWLKAVPATNAAGNFRGMVISARWKTAFQFSNKLAGRLEVAGNYLLFASLAVGVYNNSKKIDQIWHSNASDGEKAAQLSAMTSALILGALGGVVPAGTHLLMMSLQGYLLTAGGLSGGRINTSGVIKQLQAADFAVQHAYDKISNGDQLYNLINTYLVY